MSRKQQRRGRPRQRKQGTEANRTAPPAEGDSAAASAAEAAAVGEEQQSQPPPQPHQPRFVGTCDEPSCSRTNASLRCGRCHKARYCSKECQRKHWRASPGGHKHSCTPPSGEASGRAILRGIIDEDDSPKHFPHPTDRCLGRGCQGDGTLELPFRFCLRHWVCANCAVRAALANPMRPSCPLCGQPYPSSNGDDPNCVIVRLSIGHMWAGTRYIKYTRLLPEVERVSIARRLQDADAYVKESYHAAVVPRSNVVDWSPDTVHAYSYIESFLRANVMAIGKDPAALEEIRTATAAVQRTFIRAFDNVLQEIGNSTSRMRARTRSFVLEAKHKVQLNGVTCQMLVDGIDMIQIIFTDSILKLIPTMRGLEADTLEQLGRWDEALEVYRDLTHSDQRSQALLRISECRLKLQKACALEAAALESKRNELEEALLGANLDSVKLVEALRSRKRAPNYEMPSNQLNHETNSAFLHERRASPKVERGGRMREEDNLDSKDEHGQVLSFVRTAEQERSKREEAFAERWADALDLVGQRRAQGNVSWSSIKWKEYGMFAEGGDDVEEEERLTANRLDSAVSAAIRAKDNGSVLFDDPDIEDDNFIIDRGGIKTKVDFENAPVLVFDRFKITKEVRKWWTQGDNKHQDFFVRRVRQLAAGDRSRILQKRLTGSTKTIIFETYLEQKSGFRILWTEAADEINRRSGITIWYVSPHDHVSRYMRRIDEAETRSIRQLTAMSAVSDLMSAVVETDADPVAANDLRHDEVVLDPFADTPLKLYALRYEDLNRMAASTWLPPLYLTTEEREIVETEGTVLLLGRSGTGKTVCICNRIDFDRHLAEGDPTFSQLFVARSQRICRSVAGTVESFNAMDDNGSSLISYATFRKLLDDCEGRVSDVKVDPGSPFPPTSRIDYKRFRAFMAQFNCELEPLIVWTQIRSFIKGSVEAVTKGRPLTLEEYLDTSVIGSRRCRLEEDKRQVAYAVYEKYERYRTSRNQWDDCDRVGALVKRLCGDRSARERVARRRVYVDEIQDYSQVEIALFFLICDVGGLFLAGDPAQSVVEGIEFRFEEVRSVAHHLYSNDSKSRRYIPQKPLSVTRNFRSHAGILNVAAEILDKMFLVFPWSAKELPKDKGLFRGPRPSVFQAASPDVLLNLISKVQGVVLLSMHDDHVRELHQLQAIEAHGTVVLSIRDAKGLEFSDVILVDFFCRLPLEQQKPWRLLLQGKLVEASRLPGFPEVENQLKLLYTAITRCSRRLYFVETSPSDSGKAFVRFLCSETQLAVRQAVEDVQESIKAVDEWGATGVQYAVNAEASESEESSLYWLDRALYCFRQGKVKDLERKVEVHLDSIRLRTEHAKWTRSDVKDENLEKLASQHLSKLAEEGLLREAALYFDAIMPLLSDFTRQALEERLLPFLPDRDDD